MCMYKPTPKKTVSKSSKSDKGVPVRCVVVFVVGAAAVFAVDTAIVTATVVNVFTLLAFSNWMSQKWTPSNSFFHFFSVVTSQRTVSFILSESCAGKSTHKTEKHSVQCSCTGFKQRLLLGNASDGPLLTLRNSIGQTKRTQKNLATDTAQDK